MNLTKREMDEYNRIQDLWAVRKATSKQILRALDLRRKAEAKPERKDGAA